MRDPRSFYHSQIAKYQKLERKAARDLNVSAILRLMVFLITAGLIYVYFGNFPAVIGVLLMGVGVFIFLVSRHAELVHTHDKFKELVRINETETTVLHNKFDFLPSGEEFKDPSHPFSEDIDLFGTSSFFQYLNRTSLAEGKQLLAEILDGNTIEGIPQKQEAIRELSEKADWRQLFSALAGLVKTETRTPSIVEWLNSYRRFVPDVMRWVPLVFSCISLLAIVGFFLEYLSGMSLGGWFAAGLLLTGVYLKRINHLSSKVSKVQDTFHQYYQLLELIEETEFHSEILRNKKQKALHQQQKASSTLRKFSRAIDALDQRNNMLIGVLGNGFLLRDLRQSFRLEKWITENRSKVAQWFKLIEFLDAYNSLGNFAFNHPSYVFPQVDEKAKGIQVRDLSHPLLNPKDRISNDLIIGRSEFFIITGANMAGKSTFLRTVSLLILMSNVGLPVCASQCSYSPIKLITSMRTSDSLSDNESYFFSELKRLKFIVERIQTDRYFIILDEILKGTNSTDKAMGSKKFIEKLVDSKSTGIIATHDLSLCEVTTEHPEVKNYYFDAEIIQDELFFDYKLKPGICQNMNASFLLKKMKIVE